MSSSLTAADASDLFRRGPDRFLDVARVRSLTVGSAAGRTCCSCTAGR